MFRSLPLSTKLLLTFVPLLLVLIADAYFLTARGQEEAMLEQAKTAAFQRASIVRLALVQEMVHKQRVEDAFLEGLQRVGGLEDLYIRIRVDNLHLKDWLDDDSTRTPRLMARENYAKARGPIGDEVFTSGSALYVPGESNIEAIIPFKAEKRCQSCHEVELNHVLGAAHITVPLTAIRASIASNSQRTALITFGFGLLTILAGGLLYRQLIRTPIRKLVAATEAIAQGNLNFDLPLSDARDELGMLARSFDGMRKALRTAQDALRTSMMGQIAASLVRDFRAPMRQILAAMDQLEKGDADPAGRTSLITTARTSVVDMNRMAVDLLDFTTGDMKVNKRAASVGSLLSYVADSVRPDLDRDGVKVEIPQGTQTAAGNAMFDYERLARAVTNIVAYAANYVPPGGMIRLSSRSEGKGFQIVIEDNGSGIPPQFRDRVFEPFTKIVQEKGLGLNMALAKRIVETQGGSVRLDSTEGKGSTFTITMPGT